MLDGLLICALVSATACPPVAWPVATTCVDDTHAPLIGTTPMANSREPTKNESFLMTRKRVTLTYKIRVNP